MVVWEGALQAPSTGLYTFKFTTDDGIRVFISGSLFIDEWNIQVGLFFKKKKKKKKEPNRSSFMVI